MNLFKFLLAATFCITVSNTWGETDTTGKAVVFSQVEKPAEFPGGAEGWRTYLEANLRYPKKAQKKGIQGIVRVRFHVDKEGNLSNVEALNNPGYGLAKEAIRVIEEGPKWKPAEQNGRKVIYIQIQTITFWLE